MNPGFQSIRGMHDILPADMAIWQWLESNAARIFGSYGFEEIRVPLLEKTEVFTRAIGTATDVVEKEMYSFTDRNGDSLSLRPEGTAGIVRAVLQNGLLYGSPQRLWYGGAMFRHERPQKGRTRQFHQLGAEVFGGEGPDVDAELIAMGERLWKVLGLNNLRLEINCLGTAEERSIYRQQLSAFLHSIHAELDEETRERAERNPLRVLDSKSPKVQALLGDAPSLLNVMGVESREHFAGLQSLLKRLSIDFVVNPRLVRGLDYYSHTVFEWISDDLGAQGTVCAGGRYDNLIVLQGGKPWPGIGFAMGQERLVELIRQGGGIEATTPHIYFVLAGADAKAEGLALAEQLRDAVAGIRLVCNPGDGSIKSQFKRADRSGAQLALVLAEDELKKDAVTIKYLRHNLLQEQVPMSELQNWIMDWLARQ